MGKRIVIPEFRLNGKLWVVIPRQEKDWYPSLVDHASIIVGIGMCEERKYPQEKGKQGWRYTLRYYQDCIEIIVGEYTLTDNGLIAPPAEWDMGKIHRRCQEIYTTRYDSFKNPK